MTGKIKATIMGCGASLGVPAAGNFWGDCNPDNPKNLRTRSSLLLQSEQANILVDSTVDVRQHMNTYDIKRLDGIIYSHAHSDHINGMDDLRVISYVMEHPIEIYGDHNTISELHRRFDYVFHGGHNVYRPFLKSNVIDYGPHRIGDIRMDLFKQDHGTCDTTGIRINDFAYSVDMVDLDETALKTLKGVKTWVVDAAGYKREKASTHALLDDVLKWSHDLQVEQTYLVVLTGLMDYDVLCNELPDNVRPAYDGLVLEI